MKKHREGLLYVAFGMGTFVIDVGVFGLLSGMLPAQDSSLSLHFCSIISTLLAITFAFITNRRYVFQNRQTGWKTVFRQGVQFYGARFFTMIISEILLEVTVIQMNFNDWLMKLLINILVVLFNYLASKFWIFKNNDTKKGERDEKTLRI